VVAQVRVEPCSQVGAFHGHRTLPVDGADQPSDPTRRLAQDGRRLWHQGGEIGEGRVLRAEQAELTFLWACVHPSAAHLVPRLAASQRTI
jgi:hypothetical protein